MLPELTHSIVACLLFVWILECYANLWITNSNLGPILTKNALLMFFLSHPCCCLNFVSRWDCNKLPIYILKTVSVSNATLPTHSSEHRFLNNSVFDCSYHHLDSCLENEYYVFSVCVGPTLYICCSSVVPLSLAVPLIRSSSTSCTLLHF